VGGLLKTWLTRRILQASNAPLGVTRSYAGKGVVRYTW
jgi:hypothetical protein